LAAAAANGRKGGRPREVDDADAAKARSLRDKGIAATDIAKMLGVSRATVYRSGLMPFTALHRLLGLAPSPLTDEMIDSAVAEKLAETDDLDFKRALPETGGLNATDYPKDIAAMANSGGGVILYGVAEEDKKATARVDVGDLSEGHERTLRIAAVNAISPPVFGLDIVKLGADNRRCVAIIVPASVDGPHLIYRNELFGAPIRNDADTVWMKERQIETAYRARFDERRHSAEVLDRMHQDLAVVTEVEARAWLIAVGRPRVRPAAAPRWDRSEAGRMIESASARSLTYARRTAIRPLEIVERLNPRLAFAAKSLWGCLAILHGWMHK
jgi:hypothetical protein